MNSDTLTADVTHVVVSDMRRTEKTLGGFLSSRWVCIAKWVTDSVAAKQWVLENSIAENRFSLKQELKDVRLFLTDKFRNLKNDESAGATKKVCFAIVLR